MHFQKVASEVFKRTQEAKTGLDARDLHHPRQALGGRNAAGLGNPYCNPPRAAAGERLPKITLCGFQVERREGKPTMGRPARSGPGSTSRQTETQHVRARKSKREVIWRWDALPQAASSQGSEDSVLPHVPASSTKGKREMQPCYLSPFAARA